MFLWKLVQMQSIPIIKKLDNDKELIKEIWQKIKFIIAVFHKLNNVMLYTTHKDQLKNEGLADK